MRARGLATWLAAMRPSCGTLENKGLTDGCTPHVGVGVGHEKRPDPELARIAAAWGALPEEVRQALVLLVNAAIVPGTIRRDEVGTGAESGGVPPHTLGGSCRKGG